MVDFADPENEKAPRSNVRQPSRKDKSLKARPYVRIKRNDGQEMIVHDRPAQTLWFLDKVKSLGATRLEFTAAGWARSVPSYVHDLRRLGFAIESPLELIEQGVRVSRYRLLEEIQILETNIGGAK